MSIKKSFLEQKWYYRVAKMFYWLLPLLILAFDFFGYLVGSDSAYIGYFVSTLFGLIPYYLIVYGIWRVFLYIKFGGLENDTKKKVVPVVQVAQVVQPAGSTVSAPTPAQPPTKGPVHIIIEGLISLFLLGLFGYLAVYTLSCAQGNHRGNGDVSCQSIYEFFNSSSSYVAPGSNTNSSGNPLCAIANRCPANAPWYCTGQYYDANGTQRSLNGCLPTTAAQAGYSSWSGKCYKCP
jgi:hypothetical protein